MINECYENVWIYALKQVKNKTFRNREILQILQFIRVVDKMKEQIKKIDIWPPGGDWPKEKYGSSFDSFIDRKNFSCFNME